MFKKITVYTLLASVLVYGLVLPQPAHAQVLVLPKPGTMVNLSEAYEPLMIKGVKIDPKNPMRFDFLVSSGDDTDLKIDSTDSQLRQESNRLIKYFLACLTIPENDLWVNLSPYEKDRMIPAALGQTELGRDLLAQDYILKQLTASLIYPEDKLGKAFWDRVYAKAQQLYGTTEIPVNTFNKVWILADTAKVFERDNTAFVVGAHLKVMLDTDYLSLEKHSEKTVVSDQWSVNSEKQPKNNPLTTDHRSLITEKNNIGSQIIRELIIPEIEHEINSGKNFAPIRQIFHAFILASWYKKSLKQALLNQVYTDKGKVKGMGIHDEGVRSTDPLAQRSELNVETIYQQYLQAYKKGVFNYIKEPANSDLGGAKKYFSGGTKFASDSVDLIQDPAQLTPEDRIQLGKADFAVTADIQTVNQSDAAMSNEEVKAAIEEGKSLSREISNALKRMAQIATQQTSGVETDITSLFHIFYDQNTISLKYEIFLRQEESRRTPYHYRDIVNSLKRLPVISDGLFKDNLVQGDYDATRESFLRWAEAVGTRKTDRSQKQDNTVLFAQAIEKGVYTQAFHDALVNFVKKIATNVPKINANLQILMKHYEINLPNPAMSTPSLSNSKADAAMDVDEELQLGHGLIDSIGIKVAPLTESVDEGIMHLIGDPWNLLVSGFEYLEKHEDRRTDEEHYESVLIVLERLRLFLGIFRDKENERLVEKKERLKVWGEKFIGNQRKSIKTTATILAAEFLKDGLYTENIDHEMRELIAVVDKNAPEIESVIKSIAKKYHIQLDPAMSTPESIEVADAAMKDSEGGQHYVSAQNAEVFEKAKRPMKLRLRQLLKEVREGQSVTVVMAINHDINRVAWNAAGGKVDSKTLANKMGFSSSEGFRGTHVIINPQVKKLQIFPPNKDFIIKERSFYRVQTEKSLDEDFMRKQILKTAEFFDFEGEAWSDFTVEIVPSDLFSDWEEDGNIHTFLSKYQNRKSEAQWREDLVQVLRDRGSILLVANRTIRDDLIDPLREATNRDVYTATTQEEGQQMLVAHGQNIGLVLVESELATTSADQLDSNGGYKWGESIWGEVSVVILDRHIQGRHMQAEKMVIGDLREHMTFIPQRAPTRDEEWDAALMSDAENTRELEVIYTELAGQLRMIQKTVHNATTSVVKLSSEKRIELNTGFLHVFEAITDLYNFLLYKKGKHVESEGIKDLLGSFSLLDGMFYNLENHNFERVWEFKSYQFNKMVTAEGLLRVLEQANANKELPTGNNTIDRLNKFIKAGSLEDILLIRTPEISRLIQLRKDRNLLSVMYLNRMLIEESFPSIAPQRTKIENDFHHFIASGLYTADVQKIVKETKVIFEKHYPKLQKLIAATKVVKSDPKRTEKPKVLSREKLLENVAVAERNLRRVSQLFTHGAILTTSFEYLDHDKNVGLGILAELKKRGYLQDLGSLRISNYFTDKAIDRKAVKEIAGEYEDEVWNIIEDADQQHTEDRFFTKYVEDIIKNTFDELETILRLYRKDGEVQFFDQFDRTLQSTELMLKVLFEEKVRMQWLDWAKKDLFTDRDFQEDENRPKLELFSTDKHYELDKVERVLGLFKRSFESFVPVLRDLIRDIRNQEKTKIGNQQVSNGGISLDFPPEKLREFDSAMNSTGGIDLKSQDLKLEVQKQGPGVEMILDPALIEKFQSGHFQGLEPVIMKITPISGAWMSLGLTPPTEQTQLASL